MLAHPLPVFERQYLWNEAINHIAISVQIMSNLGASEIIYSDVIHSFIEEILKYKMSVIVPLTENP